MESIRIHAMSYTEGVLITNRTVSEHANAVTEATIISTYIPV
jgi:hypothetical protein